MHALAITTDSATAYAILIASVAGAVVSVITALQNRANKVAMRPPSNSVSNGAITENTNVALHVATHLLAEALGKRVDIPSPAETAAGLPGATLLDPPPASVVTAAAPSTQPAEPDDHQAS